MSTAETVIAERTGYPLILPSTLPDDVPVTLVLQTSGDYSELKRVL